MINLFNYIQRPSPIHELTGASKLIALLMFSISTMTSFYTPFLAVVALIALVLFRLSKIRLREVSFLVGAVTVFMLMNNVLIFLFSPEHGVSLYGSRHVLLSGGGVSVYPLEKKLCAAACRFRRTVGNPLLPGVYGKRISELLRNEYDVYTSSVLRDCACHEHDAEGVRKDGTSECAGPAVPDQ